MSPPLARWPPGLRKLLILALATLAWLLLAEVGFRIYGVLRGKPYTRGIAEARLDALIDGLKGVQFLPEAAKNDIAKSGMAIHPYQGYQIAWFTRSGQASTRYFASPGAATDFDLVLIGGSVAAEFGNWADQHLIPALRRDPRLAERPIRLHNVACPGHKQPQHALTLQWLLSQGWKPDAVLLLDGFNELAVAAENALVGVSPLFPFWIEMQMRLGSATNDPEELRLLGRAVLARDEAEALHALFKRWPMNASALAGSWAVRALQDAVRRTQRLIREVQSYEAAKVGTARSATISGPGFEDDSTARREQTIGAWREGSRSMQAICRARGIPFLHVLQPAACDTGSKPLTPEETRAAAVPELWARAVAEGYPRLREVGAELAKEGIHFFDGSRVFAGSTQPIYRDNCHFGAAGCAILGPLVAEALLKVLND